MSQYTNAKKWIVFSAFIVFFAMQKDIKFAQEEAIGIPVIDESSFFLAKKNPEKKTSNRNRSKRKKIKKKSLLNEYIKVNRVEGKVHFWVPLGGKWRQLRSNQILPLGTLIQIPGEASIDYTFHTLDLKGWAGTDAYINVKVPVNLRLERNILREVKLSEYYFKKLPAQKIEEEREVGLADVPAILEDAWNRVSIFFDQEKTTPDFIEDLYAKAKQPIEIGVRSKKLQLLRPIAGGSKVALNFPFGYRVIWKVPKKYKLGHFKVYFWNALEAKIEPYGISESNSFKVIVNKPGSYYVQVTTEKNEYVSEAHAVHFVDGEGGKRLANKESKTKYVRPVFPPEKFATVGKENIDLLFSWYIDPVVSKNMAKQTLVLNDLVKRKKILKELGKRKK